MRSAAPVPVTHHAMGLLVLAPLPHDGPLDAEMLSPLPVQRYDGIGRQRPAR
jgi:hypothetical protein